MIRRASAVGFYPGDPVVLKRTIKGLFKGDDEPMYSAGIVPHAGYMYSGLAAASLFKTLKKTDTIVILGNDHYGNAIDISLHPYTHWETPLGKVPVDDDLAERLEVLNLPETESPNEHSIEVQIPFLQYLWDDIAILPITVPTVSLERLKEFGESLRKLNATIIATTDFSHYVPRDVASQLDSVAIENIIASDTTGLERIVNDLGVSMCGLHPVLALMFAYPKMEKELLMYYTSGDVSGDNSSVVGYGSIGFR
ncbi:MAG: AmmeMemoRadiSam system protein B [Candidatus Altiarchaeota archaeon]|nr:AmmeMemoRadiSam system protein B [Candidatus Altiarchaeota archaeon]